MSARAMKRAIVGALSLVALLSTIPTCSYSNHEGPLVTCADLECGRHNACKDGIIASCLDRVTVKYYVCYDNALDVCEEDWQIPGEYRCEENMPDCIGCSPTALACGAGTDGGAGGGT